MYPFHDHSPSGKWMTHQWIVSWLFPYTKPRIADKLHTDVSPTYNVSPTKANKLYKDVSPLINFIFAHKGIQLNYHLVI